MNEIIRKDILNLLTKVDLEKLRGKKVLITGSNGLIGTYLASVMYVANRERKLDVNVTGLSKHPPNGTMKEFLKDKRFSFYTEDLVNAELNYPADYIVHAATYAQPGKFLKNKLETVRLNTEVTKKLLRLCGKQKSTFLFLSSSEVYGTPPEKFFPTPETFSGNCSTTSARAAYAESKRLGETICNIFREEHGIYARIARVSHVYGPGISIYDERVLGNFLKKALIAKHIELLDKGTQIRTWCYVADCVAMLLNIILHGKSFIYNVGGKDTVSIRQLAEIICELTQSGCSLPEKSEQTNSLKGATDRVEMDIRKVLAEFDIGEFTNLRKGLENTIRWNRETIL